MQKILMTLLFILFFTVSGCTEKERVKQFGGEITIQLESHRKLIDVTWKGSDLWYLTREMRDDEYPQQYEFREDSNLGIAEGVVIFQETRVHTVDQ